MVFNIFDRLIGSGSPMEERPDQKSSGFLRSLRFWRTQENDTAEAILTGAVPWSGPPTRETSRECMLEPARKASQGSSAASEDVGVQTSSTRIVERMVNPPPFCCHHENTDSRHSFSNRRSSCSSKNNSSQYPWYDAQEYVTKAPSGSSARRENNSLPSSRVSVRKKKSNTSSKASLGRSLSKRASSNRSRLEKLQECHRNDQNAASNSGSGANQPRSRRGSLLQTWMEDAALQVHDTESDRQRLQKNSWSYGNRSRYDGAHRDVMERGQTHSDSQWDRLTRSKHNLNSKTCLDCHRARSCQYHVPYRPSAHDFENMSPQVMRNLEEAARMLSKKEFENFPRQKELFHPLEEDPNDKRRHINWRMILLDLALVLIFFTLFVWWYTMRYNMYLHGSKADAASMAYSETPSIPCKDCGQYSNPFKNIRDHFRLFTDAFSNMRDKLSQ